MRLTKKEKQGIFNSLSRIESRQDEIFEEMMVDFKEASGFIFNDKFGNRIYQGQKFKFKYMEDLHKTIDLIGSFSWNNDELRYEIDVYDNSRYICLSYISNGQMSDFDKSQVIN